VLQLRYAFASEIYIIFWALASESKKINDQHLLLAISVWLLSGHSKVLPDCGLWWLLADVDLL